MSSLLREALILAAGTIESTRESRAGDNDIGGPARSVIFSILRSRVKVCLYSRLRRADRAHCNV